MIFGLEQQSKEVKIISSFFRHTNLKQNVQIPGTNPNQKFICFKKSSAVQNVSKHPCHHINCQLYFLKVLLTYFSFFRPVFCPIIHNFVLPFRISNRFTQYLLSVHTHCVWQITAIGMWYVEKYLSIKRSLASKSPIRLLFHDRRLPQEVHSLTVTSIDRFFQIDHQFVVSNFRKSGGKIIGVSHFIYWVLAVK